MSSNRDRFLFYFLFIQKLALDEKAWLLVGFIRKLKKQRAGRRCLCRCQMMCLYYLYMSTYINNTFSSKNCTTNFSKKKGLPIGHGVMASTRGVQSLKFSFPDLKTKKQGNEFGS
jgi:hypothetical protein